jgi:hypothetical protein
MVNGENIRIDGGSCRCKVVITHPLPAPPQGTRDSSTCAAQTARCLSKFRRRQPSLPQRHVAGRQRKARVSGRLGESLSVKMARATLIAALNALGIAQEHLGNINRLKSSLSDRLVVTTDSLPTCFRRRWRLRLLSSFRSVRRPCPFSIWRPKPAY